MSQKKLTKTQRQILKRQEEIRRLREKERIEKKAKRVIKKVAKPGRPAIPKSKLEEAELLAYDHPLSWVSFKTDISLSTLKRHGITRRNLEARINQPQKDK